jgi:murein DD-endopeptidase MepM/ murein hydrolase activator NlpD
MSFKFTSHKLLNGLFEPEGIYLAPPIEGPLVVLQGWGAQASPQPGARYNGVPLKGHVGIDIALAPGALLLATDAGRVIELGLERGGFERYIKIEHRWGESLYANLGEPLVESGQTVQRGDPIARPLESEGQGAGRRWFHFGVRVSPFNRYDGWGGFTDPTAYLPSGSLVLPGPLAEDAATAATAQATSPGPGLPATQASPTTPADSVAGGWQPHPMADERQGMRRP